MKKKDENLLNYIPELTPQCRWHDDGCTVTVEVLNAGVFNRLAQLFLKKPKITFAKLDVLGSFVWKSIDGVRSLMQLAEVVYDEFGDDAEPLYARLSAFFAMLIRYRLVAFKDEIGA
ncbi:MAG: PqqD family protein [Hydrogenoanaerobacterium sp.]